MRIKMVLFDLDGTLLNSQKEITPETRRALELAGQAGVELVPSTGRYFEGIPEYLRRLPYVHYAVTVNGAQVVEAATGKALYKAEIPYERGLEIWRLLDELPGYWDCYFDNQGYIDQRDYDHLETYVKDPALLAMIRRLRNPVPDLRAFLDERKPDLQKTQIFLRDHETQVKAMAALKGKLPELNLSCSVPTNIEINAAGATKGAGLEFLRDYLGLSKAETMALGDSTNDIPMLRAAGVGVAMGNALEEVKAAADFVTETNDRNGAALAIRRFCPGA